MILFTIKNQDSVKFLMKIVGCLINNCTFSLIKRGNSGRKCGFHLNTNSKLKAVSNVILYRVKSFVFFWILTPFRSQIQIKEQN